MDQGIDHQLFFFDVPNSGGTLTFDNHKAKQLFHCDQSQNFLQIVLDHNCPP